MKNNDMDNERYVVAINLGDPEIGFGWTDHDVRHAYRYKLLTPSIECARGYPGCAFEVVKKVPKEQARRVEAALAPFRKPDNKMAVVPISLYATVDKLNDDARWDQAVVTANVDAIAVQVPGKAATESLFLIDGPEIKRK
jgi:hypothetical protein